MKPRNTIDKKFARLVQQAHANPHRTSRKVRTLGHRYDRRAANFGLNQLVGLDAREAQEAAHELPH